MLSLLFTVVASMIIIKLQFLIINHFLGFANRSLELGHRLEVLLPYRWDNVPKVK